MAKKRYGLVNNEELQRKQAMDANTATFQSEQEKRTLRQRREAEDTAAKNVELAGEADKPKESMFKAKREQEQEQDQARTAIDSISANFETMEREEAKALQDSISQEKKQQENLAALEDKEKYAPKSLPQQILASSLPEKDYKAHIDKTERFNELEKKTFGYKQNALYKGVNAMDQVFNKSEDSDSTYMSAVKALSSMVTGFKASAQSFIGGAVWEAQESGFTKAEEIEHARLKKEIEDFERPVLEQSAAVLAEKQKGMLSKYDMEGKKAPKTTNSYDIKDNYKIAEDEYNSAVKAEGFWGGFFQDKVGVLDIRRNLNYARLTNKVKNEEKLTEEETDLLESFKVAEEALNGNLNTGFLYGVGKSVRQSAEFMLESIAGTRYAKLGLAPLSRVAQSSKLATIGVGVAETIVAASMMPGTYNTGLKTYGGNSQMVEDDKGNIQFIASDAQKTKEASRLKDRLSIVKGKLTKSLNKEFSENPEEKARQEQELESLYREEAELYDRRNEIVDENDNLRNPEVSALRSGADALLKNTVENMAERYVGTAFDMAAPALTRPITNKLSKYASAGKLGRAMDATTTGFNKAMKRADDMVFQSSDLGKMSRELYTNIGPAKMVHSLPAEMFEEVVVQLVPTLQDDYAEQLNELTSSDFYVNVAASVLAIGGGAATIGSANHYKSMLSDKDYKKAYNDNKERIKMQKQQYLNIDNAIDDETLAKDIAMHTTGTLYDPTSIEARVSDLRNMEVADPQNRTKEERFKLATELENKVFLNMALNSLQTGTQKNLKRTLARLTRKEGVSEETRKSAALGMEKIDTYEEIISANKERINNGEVIHRLIQQDLNKGTIQNLEKEREKLFPAFAELAEDHITRYAEAFTFGKEPGDIPQITADDVREGIDTDFKNLSDEANAQVADFLNYNENDEIVQKYLAFSKASRDLQDSAKENDMILKYEMNPANIKAIRDREVAKITQEKIENVTAENAETTKVELEQLGEIKPNVTSAVNTAAIESTRTAPTQKVPRNMKGRKKEAAKRKQGQNQNTQDNTQDNTQEDLLRPIDLETVTDPKENASTLGDNLLPPGVVTSTIGEAFEKPIRNLETASVDDVKNAKPIGDLFGDIDEAPATGPKFDPAKNPARRKKAEGAMTSAQKANLRNVQQGLFSPMELDPEDQVQNEFVNNLAEGFRKILASNPQLDFDGMIASLRSAYSGRNVEQKFNLAREAWEQATGAKMSDAQAQKVYNDNFADVTSVSEIAAAFGGSTPTSSSQKALGSSATTKEIKEGNKSVVNPTKEIDPTTNEAEEVEYENNSGVRLYNGTGLKFGGVLGINYVEVDGVKQDLSEQVNQEARVFMDPRNFKEGDKVSMTFNMRYFLNPENVVTFWDNLDAPNMFLGDEKPTRRRLSVQTALLSIFKGTPELDSWPKIEAEIKKVTIALANVGTSEMSEENKAVLANSPLMQNELFLKIIPIGVVNKGYDTEIKADGSYPDPILLGGLNDYYWFNNSNVALRADKKTGRPVPAERELRIEENRQNNLNARKAILANGSVETTIDEVRDAVNNTRLLKTEKEQEQGYSDAFYSLFGEFGNDVKEFHKNAGVAFVGNSFKLVGGVNNAGKDADLRIDGKVVKENQIVNAEDLKKKNVFKLGRTIFVHKFGIDSQGNDLYLAHEVINNHVSKQTQFEAMREIATNLPNLMANNSAAKQRFEAVMGYPFNTRFVHTMSDLAPSKLTKSTTSGYRQDFKASAYTPGLFDTIPDFSQYESADAFMKALLAGEEIATIDKRQSVIQNIHTNIVFTPLVKNGETRYTNASQPLIEFRNSDIPTMGEKARVSKTEAEIQEEIRAALERKIAADEKELQDAANSKIEKDILEKELRENKALLLKAKMDAAAQKATEEAERKAKEEEAKKGGKSEVKLVSSTRNFNINDRSAIIEEVLKNVFKALKITDKVDRRALYASAEIEYDRLTAELEEKGLTREAEFMKAQRDTIVSENAKYDDSIKEYLDALMSLDEEEAIMSQTGENVKATGKASYEVDMTQSLGFQVKFMIGFIKNYKKDPGFGGFEPSISLTEALSALQEILGEAKNNSVADIMAIIQSKVARNPKELALFGELGDKIKQLEKENPSVLNEILYSLYQPKVEMKFVMWDRDARGKNVLRVLDANVKNPLFLKRDEWAESLKASPLIDLYEGNHYTINEETFKRLDTLHKNITLKYKETEDIADVDRTELEEFLKLVGITLNPMTLDNMYFQKSQADMDLARTMFDAQAIQDMEDDAEIAELNKSKLLGIGGNSIVNVIFKNVMLAKDTGEPLTFDSKEASEEGILQFNPVTVNNNQINDLIKLDNYVEFRAARSMRIAGKTINLFQQPNSITNKLKDISRDLKAYADALGPDGIPDESKLVGSLKEFAETSITSNSFLLDMAKKNPKEMAKFIGSFLISLEALKEAGSASRNDMNMTELSDKDAFTTIMGMFSSSEGEYKDRDFDIKYDGKLKLRKGLMNFSTISDSAQLPFLKTILLELSADNVNLEEDILDEAVLDVLKQQLLVSDLRRMADFQYKIGSSDSPESTLNRVSSILKKANEVFDGEFTEVLKTIKTIEFGDSRQYSADIINAIESMVSQEAFDNVKNQVQGSFVDTSNINGYDIGAKWITGLPSLNALQLPYSYESKGSVVKTTRSLKWLFENFVAENPEENSKHEAIDKFLETYTKEIHTHINQNITYEVNKYISKDGLSGSFVEHELLDKKGRLEFSDGKKDGYFDKKPARLIAYDYVVNTFIQQKDIQTLFAGDVAQYFTEKMDTNLKHGLPEVTYKDILEFHYSSQEDAAKIKEIFPSNFDPEKVSAKKLTEIFEAFPELKYADEFITPGSSSFEEAYTKNLPIASMKINRMFKGVQNNLSKRLKGLVSPGNQFPNSKNLPPYIQVMLNDVDSASETLEYLTSLHHPESLELARPLIQKFKKLDNMYNRSVAQEKAYKETFKDLQKLIPTISAYLKTSSTDAQEYTSWKENLNQLKEQGRMTNEVYDAIYKKLEAQTKDLLEGIDIKSENMLSPEEVIAAVMQPTKPLYSGMVFQNANGSGHNVQRYVYIKSSSFPLIPEMTKMFPKLDNMRKVSDLLEAQENTTVRMSFQSANKVGAVKNAINVSELHDASKVNLDNVMKSSLLLDRANFYIQQDKPFKGDSNAELGKRDEITLATQFEKIILGDGINKITEKVFPAASFDASLLEELGIKVEEGKVNGKDLKNIYDSIYKKQQKILSEQLFNRLGMDSFGDIREGKPEVMEGIAKLLKKRLDNKQDKKAMELLYEVEVDGILEVVSKEELEDLRETDRKVGPALKAMFKFPPHLTPNSRKLESVFNSVINKNSINLKVPGFSAPVASQEGFDFKGYSKTTFKKALKDGLVMSPKFDPEKGLQSERNEDGTLKYAQIFMSSKVKIYNETDGKYEYVDMTQYVGEDGLLDYSRVPEEVLSYFSFRIPTSSHQSGAVIEVVGFLPHTVGDLMIVPKDHTVQIGEDYDIDVRYVYQYNLIKDVDGNLKKLDYSDIVKPEKSNKVLRAEFNRAKQAVWDTYYEVTPGIARTTPDTKGGATTAIPLSKENFKARIKNPLFEENKAKIMEIAFLQDSLDNFEVDKLMSAMFKEAYEVDFIDKQFLVDKIAELESEIFDRGVVKEYSNDRKKEYEEIKEFIIDSFQEEASPLSVAWTNYYNSRGQRASELQVLENNLVSMYKSVFSTTDPTVRQLVTKVLSTDFSGDSAEEIDEKMTKKEEFFNIYSPTTQRKVMKLGADGKMGIGVHSNAVTLNSLLQQLDEPLSLVDRFDGDGLPVRYNIQLGEHVFDGRLGRILDSTGRRVSEYLMESQNSSLDNQKLEIMGKRNENKETISVFSLLQLNGIEANTKPINGIDVSYASIFIAQPSILRYVEDVKKLKSSTTASIGSAANKEMEAAMKIRDSYVKLVPKDDWLLDKEGKAIVGSLSEEAKEKYGAMATNVALFDEIQPLDSEINPKTAGLQLYVLDTFLTLKKASEDVNNLRAILNIESQGMGISYFNAISMKDRLMSMNELNIKSDTEFEKDSEEESRFFNNVIGDMVSSDNAETDEQLENDGYIFIEKDTQGESTWIKPKNHYSHKIVNSISLGYNMWNSIFPYDSPVVSQQIDGILMAARIEDGTAKALELKYKVISSMKDYAYTSSRVLFGSDVNQKRQELFFDNREEGNESLGSYIQRLKDSGSYVDIFDAPFFKDLQIIAAERDYPTIIKYNSGDFSPLSTLRLYNNLDSMVESDKPLPPKNGVEMTEADLMKELLMYAMLASQENGAIGFRDKLPVSLMEKYSVDKILRNRNTPEMIGFVYNGTTMALQAALGSQIDIKGVIKNTNGVSMQDLEILLMQVNAVARMNGATQDNYVMTPRGSVMLLEYDQKPVIGAFKKQYFQHNPEDVKASFKHSNDLNSPYQKFLADNNIDSNAVTRGELGSFTVKNTFEDFMSLKDENGVTYLYEIDNVYKADSDNYISNYKRIPQLGTFGFNEYQANQNIERSLVKKNNTKYNPVWNNSVINVEDVTNHLNTVNTSEIVSEMLKNKLGPYFGVISVLKEFMPNLDNVVTQTGVNLPGKASYQVVDGIPTITINEKFLNRPGVTDKMVQDAVMEEVIHYVTTSTIGDYVTFSGLTEEGFTTEIKKDANGKDVVVPVPLQALLKIYNEAVIHYMDKHGSAEIMARVEAINNIKDAAKNSSLNLNDEVGQDAYRVSDMHEFIAGLFIKDSRFALEMEKTPYKQSGKSIMARLTEAFARFLGRVMPNARLNSISANSASQLYYFLAEHHKSPTNKMMINAPQLRPKKQLPEVGSKIDAAEKAIQKGVRKFNPPTPPKAPYVAPTNRNTKKMTLFNSMDKDLKKGSVVKYDDNMYIFWSENKGKAKLIGTDGKKFSGTPNIDKLSVMGSYATTTYNKVDYIVTDNGNIYSGATGNVVFAGASKSSKDQKSKIIAAARKEKQGVSTSIGDLFSSPFENVEIRPEVEDTYKRNPKLSEIGSLEKYGDYVDSIFPESKMKDTGYHGTDSFGFDSFSKELLGANTGAPSAKLGFFFASNVGISMEYFNDGKTNTYTDIEDYEDSVTFRHKPKNHLERINDAYDAQIDDERSMILSYIDDRKGELSQEDIEKEMKGLEKSIQMIENKREEELAKRTKIYKTKLNFVNPYVYDYNFAEKRVQSYADIISWAKKQGYDSVILLNTKDPVQGHVYIALESDQIHILNSQKDIEGFKKYVKNTATTSNRDNVSLPKIITNVKLNC